MTSAITIAPSDALRRVLFESGVCDLRDASMIQPFTVNRERKDSAHKQTYAVWVADQPAVHLTVGSDLKDLSQRTTEFHQACPRITCKPLFFTQANGLDYLGREYVLGTPLSDLLKDGSISPEKARRILSRLNKTLHDDRRKTTVADALAELDQLEDELCAIDAFDPSDIHILKNAIFPELKSSLTPEVLDTGWTNGDLIARNIIVESDGNVRLIDYEFAAHTSFLPESWLRFLKYSPLPEAFGEFVEKWIGGNRKWYELLFWVRQTVLESRVNQPHAFHRHLSENVREISRLVRVMDGLLRGSFFLTDVIGRADPRRAEETLRIERVNAELRTAYDDQARILAERDASLGQATARTKKLEEQVAFLDAALAEQSRSSAELQNQLDRIIQSSSQAIAECAEANARVEQIQAQLGERTAALLQQQKLHAGLQQQLDERTRWAKALNEELERKNEEFVKVVALADERLKLVEERSAWALGLDAELARERQARAEANTCAQQIQARLEQCNIALLQQQKLHAGLQQQLDERTRWTKALNEELERKNEEFVKVVALADERLKLVEERSAWALGLDAELARERQARAEANTCAQQIQAQLEERNAVVRHLEENLADVKHEATETKDRLQQQIAQRERASHSRDRRANETIAQLDGQLTEAQNQLMRYLDEGANALRWASSLDTELSTCRNQLARAENKIQRMTHSFSWKITQPLRFLRRLFLDRFSQ